jgi:crossover junction endodeoxyribonuclease RuvC
MRVLGIDPGTVRLGYGVIDDVGGVMHLIACGVLSVSSKSPMESRLSRLYTELSHIVTRYQPEEVAIEEPFVAANARTAVAVGRAQTVAMLAAANHGLPVYRYLPAQVKQQVTAYGGSDKEQVQQMVRLLLGLTEPPCPTDASDALAIAICHLHKRRLLKNGL